MKHRHSRTRQKMSRIIDEIGAALFALGAAELSLRVKKEPEGMRLLVQGNYAPSFQAQAERLASLLQPEIRDPALAETYWELAGSDLDTGTSELALVGQILDDAHVALHDGQIELNLFIAR